MYATLAEVRVLFVDDHCEFVRTVTEQFLREHEVTHAASVEEAKSWLASEQYDVLLVDHDLTDGTGPDVIAYARSLGIASPVVAVSAHAAGNDALERAGARARCPKLRFHEVTAVLAKLQQ